MTGMTNHEFVLLSATALRNEVRKFLTRLQEHC
jgi:hypothetical protein